MPTIVWDPSFSVFNEEIDEQHKKWIDIFNAMHRILTEGDENERAKASKDALQKMQDYANFHFKFEEEYMSKIGYPDLPGHHRIHKDFDNQIYQYNRDIQDGKIVLNSEVITLLKNWLFNHITREDKRYALFLKEQNDSA